MAREMTSKERLRAAIACEPVDYVPCAPWFSGGPRVGRTAQPDHRDAFERLVGEFGVDRHMMVGLPAGVAPSVTSEFSRVDNRRALQKVFHTPEGDLWASVRRHETLEPDDDIRLVSDYNPPLYIKPWIETIQDVECFKYVWQKPDDQSIADFKQTLQR